MEKALRILLILKPSPAREALAKSLSDAGCSVDIPTPCAPVNRRKAQRAMELGPDAYVLEPLSVHEVLTTLRALTTMALRPAPDQAPLAEPAPGSQPPTPP